MDDTTTRVIVKGIRPYDGEYELDTERAFNTREWRWIKQISGYMPMTLDDGLKGGDPDVFIALAVIAMCRAHKIQREQALDVAEALAEAPFDGAAIQIVGGTVEEDEIPLALTSRPDGSSPSGTGSTENGESSSPTISGMPSSQSSGPSVASLLRTGISGSDTSVPLSGLTMPGS